jgi:hypothetical protein
MAFYIALASADHTETDSCDLEFSTLSDASKILIRA